MNLIYRFVCLEHAVFLMDPGSDYDPWACGCPRDNGASHVGRVLFDTDIDERIGIIERQPGVTK